MGLGNSRWYYLGLVTFGNNFYEKKAKGGSSERTGPVAAAAWDAVPLMDASDGENSTPDHGRRHEVWIVEF